MTHALRPLSSSNPRVKLLSRMARRSRERDEQRALIVEGPTLLGSAVDAGMGIRGVYVDESLSSAPEVRALLGRLPAGTACWAVPAGTLDRVGDAVTSQGVLAVVDRPEPVLPVASGAGFVLVLVDVADPGNVGTVVRAAVAAGAEAVVSAGGADPTAPKVLRASAGAWFFVPVLRTGDGPSTLREVSEAGYRLVGTVVDGGRPPDEVDLTGPVAIVVGNEARGLAEPLADRLHERVTIPMVGPTESLNVAMAATIMAFEVLRQRR